MLTFLESYMCMFVQSSFPEKENAEVAIIGGVFIKEIF